MSAAGRKAGAATLCAIVKDERPYLLEWIAYHKDIGFDEIVIFSNDCTDGSFEMLAALARAGEITHGDVATPRDTGPQVIVYNHMLQTCRTEWVAFLDADEFLILHKARTVGDFLVGFGDDARPGSRSTGGYLTRTVKRRCGTVLSRNVSRGPRRESTR